MAVVEPVDVRDRAVVQPALEPVDRALEPVESPLDAAPSRRHELDEDVQIVDARAPFGVDVELQPLEAADGLAGEPADLRDVPPDRKRLGAHAFANRGTKTLGDGRLEFRRSLRKQLERVTCALDRSLEHRRVGMAAGGLVEPPLRPLEGLRLHGHGR